MEVLSNPYLLVLAIVLSVVSTKFLWRGYKEKHISSWIYGLGTGIPTLAISNYKAWGVGIALCIAGYYIKNTYDL